MAVYRSDQAQLTYGAETGPGGYKELATLAGAAASKVTSGVTNPGDTSVTLSTAATGTGYAVGDFLIIGPAAAETEVRKIVHVEGSTVFFDAPLGFYHASGVTVRVPSSSSSAITLDNDGKYINIVPGVYESVDVPDPDMAIEARYFLGTASKRNFFAAYKGQQSYVGSIPGMILLDGRALRFPIGKVVTTPSAGAFTVGAYSFNGIARKGAAFVAITGTTLTAGTVLNLGYQTSVSEVRKVLAETSSGSGIYQLDYPIQFEHATGTDIEKVNTAYTGGYYTHAITETVDLDTVSWHLHMRDSAENTANDFDRRYYGGKIGSASLSAEEGGMLSMSWDSVNFMGMVHNQEKGNAGNFTATVPFHTKMQSITSTDIDFPTTEPYYFSEGSVKLFGQDIARVRSFNLSISNNEEPRYYIQRRYGRQRGPTEIREQRREYSLAVTLALPDSQVPTHTAGKLFTELLWEGDYGAVGGDANAGMRGFTMTLRFDRGINDSIVITIPDDGVAGRGGNNQGAFIRTAPHAITGENPLQVDADILFRNLKIDVNVPFHTIDPTYYYP